MRPRHECHYSEVPIATAYIIAHARQEKHPTAQKSHKKKNSARADPTVRHLHAHRHEEAGRANRAKRADETRRTYQMGKHDGARRRNETSR